MNISAAWVGIGKNSQLNTMYTLNLTNLAKDEIAKELESSYKNFIDTTSDYAPFSKNALILEEKYYYNLNSDIIEQEYLSKLNDLVLKNESLADTSEVLHFKKNRHEITLDEVYSNKDLSIKFILLQIYISDINQKQLLFLSINTRKTLRSTTILDIKLNKEVKNELKTGLDTNIVQINKGIQIPQNITAVYDYSKKYLYVMDSSSFDKMLYIHEANTAKALAAINKFEKNEYKLGIEQWGITFVDMDSIKKKVSESARASSRLANFSSEDPIYPIKDIENAVKELKDSSLLITFDHNSKKINVNATNYKTFIGIIHNGIIKRLISGDTEVIS